MPIIVDTCAFSHIFSLKDSPSYLAVHKWIFVSRGTITYGGEKYHSEMARASKYLQIITELEKTRQVVKLDDDMVNKLCPKLKELETNNSFNDEHLVAIAIVSGSTVICTEDATAETFLKKRDFYPKRSIPKIIKKTTKQKPTERILNNVRS